MRIGECPQGGLSLPWQRLFWCQNVDRMQYEMDREWSWTVTEMERACANICLRRLAAKGRNEHKPQNTGWAQTQRQVPMMVWWWEAENVLTGASTFFWTKGWSHQLSVGLADRRLEDLKEQIRSDVPLKRMGEQSDQINIIGRLKCWEPHWVTFSIVSQLHT